MISIPIPNADSIQNLEFCTLVIIGANGSGKTRLGIKIEDLTTNTHRIGAQRSLVFGDEIVVRSTSVAESFVQYGNYISEKSWTEEQRIAQAKGTRKENRWGGRPESHLLNDFDHILSLLVSLENERNAKFTKQFREGSHPQTCPNSKLDSVRRVWNLVMPQRQIDIADNRLKAGQSTSAESYHAIGMSDGERVAFYLIAQAMCVPKNALIIVDEPETHLHKAIQSRLWDAIESERADCSFVYITHDLDFAASRVDAKKLWVREYDGTTWKWDIISEIDGFPSALVLEILGSRKPILFVEGTASSIDTQLYRRIYPDFHVIPREGCGKVIESTIAMKQSIGFHSKEAFGIIDRDFRAVQQIVSLQKDRISTTSVAEAENGICLPCIVRAAAKHLKQNEEKTLDSVKVAAFAHLAKQLGHQVKERATQEIRHALSEFSSKGIGDRLEVIASLAEFKDRIDGARLYDEAKAKYDATIASNDYDSLLTTFNNKGLEEVVAKAIGFSCRQIFRDWVLAEIDAASKTDKQSALGLEMLNGLKDSFPKIGPAVIAATIACPSTMNNSIPGEVKDGNVS